MKIYLKRTVKSYETIDNIERLGPLEHVVDEGVGLALIHTGLAKSLEAAPSAPEAKPKKKKGHSTDMDTAPLGKSGRSRLEPDSSL